MRNHIPDIDKANLLMKSGAFDDAEKILKAVAADSPQDASAWHVLGNTYFRQSKLELAEICYRQRLVLTPEKAIANYSLALVLSRLNRQEEAKFYVTHALRIDPVYGPAKDLEQQLVTLTKAKEQSASTIPPRAEAPAPQSPPPQAAAAVASGALGFYDALRSDTSPISKDAVALIDQLRMSRRPTMSDSPIALTVLTVSLLLILWLGVVGIFAPRQLPSTPVPFLLSIVTAIFAYSFVAARRARRYELREGVLEIVRGNKETTTHELFRLVSVDVYRGPLQRLFNSGTLVLSIAGSGRSASKVRLVGLERGRDLPRLQDDLRRLMQLVRRNPLVNHALPEEGTYRKAEVPDPALRQPQDELRKLDHPQATPGARPVGPANDRARSSKDTSLLLPDSEDEFLDYERRIHRKERIDGRARYLARITGLPWWGKVFAVIVFMTPIIIFLISLNNYHRQHEKICELAPKNAFDMFDCD